MRKGNLSIDIDAAWTWLFLSLKSHNQFANCTIVFGLFMHSFGNCSRNESQVNNWLALFAFAFDSVMEISINTENVK